MTIFYSPNILENSVLSEEESYHCTKVLRMKIGDLIEIIDGKGTLYKAKIVLPHHKHTQVDILESCPGFGMSPYRLHLAVAPTKSIDRFEWLVEKAVEIGVWRITPLDCRYSERHRINVDRVERVVIAAAKQSLKAYVPQIDAMTSFEDFMNQSHYKQRFIAHCHQTSKEALHRICKPHRDTVVMIGAEGDFSIEEVAVAEQNGFVSVSLSESRLRTETAGVVATNIVALQLNG
ncbi:MAG: 16S rRNA (uracil(1498)-N(3))-methyltransferase [Bacteroidales bacterium]|nr:MAG: 16S rRNA (uracil(1498)-N(3))-methyltransferase [Bacteroidales bacterium]